MNTVEERVANYQRTGNLDDLRIIRDLCRGNIQATVTRYLMGPGHIPRMVLEAEADRLLIEAVKSYNPGAGAAFNTHLFNHLRRLDRFTKANANIAYKPEARANMLTNFNNQVAVLAEQKRRPPTTAEIADHMSLPVNVVERMQTSQRREIPWSHGTGTSQQNMDGARITMAINNIYPELTVDEKLVLDHIFGQHGRKKLLAGGDIAKATGFSQAKVSQIRTRIAVKLKPYLTTPSAGVE